MTNESTLDITKNQHEQKKPPLSHTRNTSDYQYKLERMSVRQESDDDRQHNNYNADMTRSKINIIDSEIMINKNTFIDNFEFLPLNINSNLNSGQSTKSSSSIINNNDKSHTVTNRPPRVPSLPTSSPQNRHIETVTTIDKFKQDEEVETNGKVTETVEKVSESRRASLINSNSSTTRRSKENIYLNEVESFSKRMEKKKELDDNEDDDEVEAAVAVGAMESRIGYIVFVFLDKH
jgi:hypothetical protein